MGTGELGGAAAAGGAGTATGGAGGTDAGGGTAGAGAGGLGAPGAIGWGSVGAAGAEGVDGTGAAGTDGDAGGAAATGTGGTGSGTPNGGAAGAGAGDVAGGVRPGTAGPIGCGNVGDGAAPGAPLASDAAARQAGGFDVPFGAPMVNVADLWNVTPGIRAFAGSDCAGYEATTVAVDPAAAPWQAHDSQCDVSIRFATTEPPVTAMSKSAIVTREPSALRGTSPADGSKTVS